MEQRKIAEAFVESMSQLMEILKMETDILNTQIYEEIDTLQARKVQLTKSYLEAQNNKSQRKRRYILPYSLYEMNSSFIYQSIHDFVS